MTHRILCSATLLLAFCVWPLEVRAQLPETVPKLTYEMDRRFLPIAARRALGRTRRRSGEFKGTHLRFSSGETPTHGIRPQWEVPAQHCR